MVKAEAPNTYWSKRSQGVGPRTYQDSTQFEKERRMNLQHWKEAKGLDKHYKEFSHFPFSTIVRRKDI